MRATTIVLKPRKGSKPLELDISLYESRKGRKTLFNMNYFKSNGVIPQQLFFTCNV